MSKRQSLGTAFRRDIRRKSAILRLEALVSFYKNSINDIKVKGALALPNGTKLDRDAGIKRQTEKLHNAEATLATTKANMGKGSSEMQKKS